MGASVAVYDKPHVEVWTLALQRHYCKLEAIGDSAVLATLEGWLRDELPSACEFHRFAIGASCNHDMEILGAAACSPDHVLAADAVNAFETGLECMLGDKEPTKYGLPAALRFWGGSEQLSSDYEPMRLRAVAGVRYKWDFDESVKALTGRYFATDAALWALAAAPGPDRVAHAANKGRLFYGGPALPPVGGRSNHFGQVENEPAFCLLAGIKAEWAENRYGDALPFLRMLNGDFGKDCAILSGIINEGHDNFDAMGDDLGVFLRQLAPIRFQERQHFARWAEGSVACWVDRQPTDLSPSYVAWVFRAGADHAEVGFPFQPDRKNRGKDQKYPLASATETDGYLVIQGGNAEASPIQLPPGPPLYHVVVGPNAAPSLQDAAGATISPPSPEPPPATDGAPSEQPAPQDRSRKRPWWRFW